MPRKISGLFLNTTEAKCSIYESGKMSYDCLKFSSIYSLDYLEINKKKRRIPGNYDFYIFNYHQATMGWLDLNFIKKLPGFKATIVLEVDVNNPFCLCPSNIFDAYLVLDPTIQSTDKKVYAFSRPLENGKNQSGSLEEPSIPTIGSFGFFGDGKGFDKLIDAVNKEFNEAIIKINTLNPDWYGDSKRFNEFVDYLKKYPTKEGVKVAVTSNYFTNEELINWCSKNTLNAFFYNRHSQGLSATTDQAIASGRPLSVSTCFTFRHIHQYIKPYPFVSLKESIENGSSAVEKIQKDWSREKFVERFDLVLKENLIERNDTASDISILLPTIKKLAIREFLRNIIPFSAVNFLSDIKRFLTKNFKIKFAFSLSSTSKCNTSNIPVFVHPAVHSYSLFQDDLLIDLFIGQKNSGFYIDVNPDNPIIDNNSYRFYKRDWHGINIIFNSKRFSLFEKFRSSDLNFKVEKDKNDFVDVDRLSKIFTANSNDKEIEFLCLRGGNELLAILKNNNWNRCRPKVVIIKCSSSFEPIRFFMEGNEYMNVLNNSHGAFFIDKFTKDNNILKMIRWD